MNNIGKFVNKMVGISVSIGAISFCVMASSMNYGSSHFPQFASPNSTYSSIATQSLCLNPTYSGSYGINVELNRRGAPQSTESGILFKRSALTAQDEIRYGNTFTSDLYYNRPQPPIGLGLHAASQQSASYAYIGSIPSKLSLHSENSKPASVAGADLRILKPNKSRSINSSPKKRSNKRTSIVGRGSRNKVQNNNVDLVVSCLAPLYVVPKIVNEQAYVPQFAAPRSNLSFSNVFSPVVFSETPLPPIVPSLSYSGSVPPLGSGQISEKRSQTQPATSFPWLADSENPYK